MPLYVHLVKLTEEGVRKVEEMPSIIEETRKLIEAEGARVLHSYSTLGRYDLVAVLEAPDDAAAMRLSAKIAAMGYFRPETLVAVPLSEFSEAVGRR